MGFVVFGGLFGLLRAILLVAICLSFEDLSFSQVDLPDPSSKSTFQIPDSQSSR